MSEDYSSAEIVRVLKAIQQEQAEMRREQGANHAAILRQIEDQRAQTALLYVRQDVYERDRKLDAAAGEGLAKEVHSLSTMRDWAIKTVLTMIIVGLVGLLIYSGSVPT